MLVTGASREHSPQALALARAHPGELFATAGVHPHHASEYTAECDAEIRELHAHPEVVAVGECGLDYFRDFSPRPAQRRAFELQLQIPAHPAAAAHPQHPFLPPPATPPPLPSPHTRNGARGYTVGSDGELTVVDAYI